MKVSSQVMATFTIGGSRDRRAAAVDRGPVASRPRPRPRAAAFAFSAISAVQRKETACATPGDLFSAERIGTRVVTGGQPLAPAGLRLLPLVGKAYGA